MRLGARSLAGVARPSKVPSCINGARPPRLLRFDGSPKPQSMQSKIVSSRYYSSSGSRSYAQYRRYAESEPDGKLPASRKATRSSSVKNSLRSVAVQAERSRGGLHHVGTASKQMLDNGTSTKVRPRLS